jgi:putative nucleotidyltransferase with HDIG domain
MVRNAGTKPKPAGPTPSVLLDEELWFGTSDGAAAEQAAASSMAATAGKVVGAKHFPESARKLAELASRESTTIPEFVQVIEQDPALSAQLLRLVNSSGFSLRQRCTSVRHAVNIVGSKQLYRIATMAAVLDLFDSETSYAVDVLQHSAAMGALCRYLGGHLGLSSEDLFTIGALHDIGKLMMLDTFAERYHPLIEQAHGQADALHRLERAEFGFDHGVLAAHVLKAWDIPDPVPKIVSWHHEPARAYESSTAHAALVQTIRLADALVHAMAQGGTRANVTQLAQHEAASYLDISEAQLGAMWPELTRLYAQAVSPAEEGAESLPAEGSVSRVRALSEGPERTAKLPKQFPCVECESPSFGVTCPACRGDLCPQHPPGAAGWCGLCAQDYVAFTKETRFPVDGPRALTAASAIIVAFAWLGLRTGDNAALARSLIAAFLVCALGGFAAVIGKRSYLRHRFLRNRPNRSRLSGPP